MFNLLEKVVMWTGTLMTIFGVTIWNFWSFQVGVIFLIVGLMGLGIGWFYFKVGNEPTERNLKVYFEHLEKDFNSWKKRFLLDSKTIQGDLMPAYAEEVEWFIDLSSQEFNIADPISKTVKVWRDELLTNGDHQMLISGTAGIGKTTCLRFLVYEDQQAFQTNKIVPIYIELKNTQPTVSLNDLLLNHLKQGKLAKALNLKSVFEHWLENGWVRLYLDGWNELPQAVKETMHKEVSNFIVQYPKVFVTISMRDAQQLFPNLRAFILQNMDRKQVIAFVERNSAKEETELRDLIFENIYRQERFLAFITVPLYALILIQIVRVDKKIPKSHAAIIDLFIKKLLEREQQIMGFAIKEKIGISLETFRHLLAYFAYTQLFKDREQNVGRGLHQIYNIFQEKQPTLTLEQHCYILNEAVELGLMVDNQGVYSFVHQEYQTYFAAIGKRLEEGKPV